MSTHTPRRSPLSIALHWLTLLMLVILVSVIYLREDMEGKALKLLLLDLHRSVGLLILLTVVPRTIMWLVYEFKHAQSSSLNLWLRLSAMGAHFALLACLLVLPIIGWMASSARGQSVSLFGWLTLPPLTSIDTDYADDLVSYHEIAAWVLFALVSLHILAALWHHFIRRDHVLINIWPTFAKSVLKQKPTSFSSGKL